MQLTTRRPASNFQFKQVTPATIWTIVHGLVDYPIVDVVVTNNGNLEKILPAAVTYVDANTCTITFNSAQIGWATLS